MGVDHSSHLRPVSIHHHRVDLALRYGYFRGRYFLFKHPLELQIQGRGTQIK